MRAFAPAAAALLAACSSSSTPPMMSADAGPRMLDPALFDCTAKSIPERASTTPVACGLDPACRTRQVAGHRGAGGTLGRIAPEDTLAAYRAGIALGLDYVETDPRPTKDGVIVNMHDPEVDRTTDGHGSVDQMTFDEVRALHVKASSFAGDFSCEKVPTLEELLTTCKGRVVVLVDANKTDHVEALVTAIQRADAIDWALFDTSDVNKIDRALAIEPRLHIQIRVSSVNDMREQLQHFAAHPPSVIEAESSTPLSATATTAHAMGSRILTDVFVQDFATNLDGDVSRYAEIYDKGADILQSDRPELVLQYLGRY